MGEEKAKDPRIIWARQDDQRQSRGPRPTLTLEQIARAAVAVADAEGLDALTMRRLAAELGIGTMSLYRYVESKDDLIDLMNDIVVTEIPRPEHPDWRTGLAWLAHQIRDQAHRHPWLTQTDQAYLFLSPNGAEYVEYLYRIVDGVGLSPDDMMNAIGGVVAYASGSVRRELAAKRRAAAHGLTEEQWIHLHGPHMAAMLKNNDHPLTERVVIEARTPHLSADDGFDQGLQGVLDSVAARVP